MSTSLLATIEEVEEPSRRANLTVNVVGCNKEGIFCLIAFAEAGFQVILTDTDQSAVKKLSKGKAVYGNEAVDQKLKNLIKTRRVTTSTDLTGTIQQSKIIILTTSPKMDTGKRIDNKEIENYFKQVGSAMRKGTLIVFAGIAGLGFIEGTAREMLENASGFTIGTDFGLAYSPLTHGVYDSEDIDNLEIQVSALEPSSLRTASIVLGTIAKKGINQVTNLKALELAVLFGAAQKDVNAALSNELAIFCESLQQDFFETRKLLEKINPRITLSPTIFEENERIPIYLLLDTAENLNVKLHATTVARQINEAMVKHAVTMTQDALRSCRKTLRRAKIALFGAPIPKLTMNKLISALEAKGAKINVYDPNLAETARSETMTNYKKTLNEAVEGTDCIIILSSQEYIKRLNFKKLHAEMKNPSALVDLVGIIELDKIEKEDYVFRSIGKGFRKT